jgi:hypothetical protein
VPFGDVVAQFIGEIFGQVMFEGLFKKVLLPALRLPGALLAWAVSRRRSFNQVWLDGDPVLQVLVGTGIHVLWIVLVIIF